MFLLSKRCFNLAGVSFSSVFVRAGRCCTVLIFLCISIFLFSSVSQAKGSQYQKIHGQELEIASVEIRQAFYQEYGWDWYESYFESRKEFLDGWYARLGKRQKSERTKLKVEHTKVREKSKKQRAILKVQREKQRSLRKKKRTQSKAVSNKNRIRQKRKRRFQKKSRTAKKRFQNLKRASQKQNR